MAPSANKSQYRWQNAPQAPFCRVHVYGADQVAMRRGDYLSSSRPVIHWAGLENAGAKVFPRDQVPHVIIGREGLYLKDDNETVLTKPVPHRWEVLSARVVLTRHWNCSSFSIQVAHPVKPGAMARNQMVPPVSPNDVIVIEMGYQPVFSPSVRLPDGRTNWLAAKNPGGRAQGDVVFVGVVDTVVERAGSGESDGIVYTIKGRDQMRWFADQKFRAHYAPGFQGELNRAFVIRDLLFQATMIDEVRFRSSSTTGRSDVSPSGQANLRIPETFEGQSTEGGGVAQTGAPTPAEAGANNSYIRLGSIEYSSRLDAPPVGREENQSPTQMLIMDKFPLQVIKHYSLVETAPRELWADHRDGRIHWMNRRTDARRLYHADPQVASTRQYYYRHPQARANVLSATNEWSVAGVVTHFTIFNPNTGAGDVSAPQIYAESPTATLRNPHFKDKFLRPMTRSRFVYDDTLREGTDTAVAVLGALFHIWGRAIQTGMVMVPGDPTLDIGEAVQLFNMGMFSRLTHEVGTDGKLADTDNVNEDGYADAEKNPEGIHRVEAVQHLFAVGGAHRGYTTVFVYGPVDEDTGQGGGFTESGLKGEDEAKAMTAPRFIRTDDEFARISAGCLAGEALMVARSVNTDQVPTVANTGVPGDGTTPPTDPQPKPEQKPPAADGKPATPAAPAAQTPSTTPQQR